MLIKLDLVWLCVVCCGLIGVWDVVVQTVVSNTMIVGLCGIALAWSSGWMSGGELRHAGLFEEPPGWHTDDHEVKVGLERIDAWKPKYAQEVTGLNIKEVFDFVQREGKVAVLTFYDPRSKFFSFYRRQIERTAKMIQEDAVLRDSVRIGMVNLGIDSFLSMLYAQEIYSVSTESAEEMGLSFTFGRPSFMPICTKIYGKGIEKVLQDTYPTPETLLSKINIVRALGIQSLESRADVKEFNTRFPRAFMYYPASDVGSCEREFKQYQNLSSCNDFSGEIAFGLVKERSICDLMSPDVRLSIGLQSKLLIVFSRSQIVVLLL